MKIISNKLVKYAPSILSTTLLLMANPGQANPPIQIAQAFRPLPMDDPSLEMPSVSKLETEETMDQVMSVSQLSDVQPTDWAFQALQSLVERYGCIAGYPDGTYKGNRAMTRFEFAAGLNACLDRITELIAAGTSNLVTREDLAILQRLQEEFTAELGALRGRVDSLEARTAELENSQFSATTKLTGEVLFWLSDTFGERATARGESSSNDKTQTVFSYRTRLQFESSFTGRDLLFTRLQANNLSDKSVSFRTNTLMTRPGIDEADGNNDVKLDLMFYQFPIGDRAQALIGPIGVDLNDVSTVLSPFADEGNGTISRFGRRNPTSFRGPTNAGVGFNYAFNDMFQINIAYLAEDPRPAEGSGVFNGAYSALGQLVIEPSDSLAFTLGYVRKYWVKNGVDITNGTGSFTAQDPFNGLPTTADNVGLQAHWRVNEKFELGGWFGSTWARPETSSVDQDDVTIINGMFYLAFPDLFREGNLGGLMVGVPPIIVDGNNDVLEDNDTSIHIEAIYRFQLNDNISLTPGLFVITNPNHDDVNDAIWVGTLRTQFVF